MTRPRSRSFLSKKVDVGPAQNRCMHASMHDACACACVCQVVCAGAGGGVGAVDPGGAGQPGRAALHLHPVHQHLPAAPRLSRLHHGLLLEEDQ